jgi:arginine decarboxylase
MAMHEAGVAGYNIIQLSSVIPSQSIVREVTGADQIKGTEGDVAYCVYAAAYASMPGEQAWAGLAWATHQDGSGAGIFVEHTAASESVLRRDLDATIDTMSFTRGHLYQVAGQIVSTAICVDHPVCAVAVAVYGTAGWQTLIDPEG